MSDPSILDVSKQVELTQVGLNLVWTLVAAFLVMFMQAGFALVETGLVRGKNVAHTMGMNFLVYAVGILGFWAVGFGLQMGGVGALGTFGNDATLSHEVAITIAGKSYGLFGAKGFFLAGSAFTPAVAATFLFQMVFMDTTATIPTGAMAERWKMASFVLFSLAIATFIYPIYANWTWGGGWLSTLGKTHGFGHGHVDFAGSSCVHLTGGVLAFVGAKMLGARRGKYGKDGSVRAIPGHNVPFVVVGTFILAFGWFGFNAGSTLSGTDTRFAVVAVNTMLASAAGAAVSTAVVWKTFGKPDVTMMCNGMLAGLVAITAPCAFVSAPAAVAIGAIAGVLVVVATLFVEKRLAIDDPVGAIAVHGVCGAFGVLAVGIFADGTYGDGLNGVAGGVRGALYGDKGQLLASCIAIVANVAWVAPLAALSLFAIGKTVGNRVSAEDEDAGLDVPEMGVVGYAADGGKEIAETVDASPVLSPEAAE